MNALIAHKIKIVLAEMAEAAYLKVFNFLDMYSLENLRKSAFFSIFYFWD
jgi:hypothetical protein